MKQQTFERSRELNSGPSADEAAVLNIAIAAF
jgi:hypothetical protein